MSVEILPVVWHEDWTDQILKTINLKLKVCLVLVPEKVNMLYTWQSFWVIQSKLWPGWFVLLTEYYLQACGVTKHIFDC